MKQKFKRFIKSIFIFKTIISLYYQLKYKYLYPFVLNEIRRLSNANVNFVFVQTPDSNRIKSLSDFEKYRLENWTFDFNNISNEDAQVLSKLYGNAFSVEYLMKVYDGVKIIKRGNAKIVADYSSEMVNVINGMRLTVGQPIEYVNTIHFYGACTARGTGVEDKHTIESILQEKINTVFPNSYKVFNHSVGCGSSIHDDLIHIRETSFYNGDTVVLCTNLSPIFIKKFAKDSIKAYDTSMLFNRPHNYGEWFTDETVHTNFKGNNVIAQYIFEMLETNSFIKISNDKYDKKLALKEEIQLVDDFCNNQEFNSFITNLCNYKIANIDNKKIGAIVMNCNPFTLGHRYLIEKASKQVDYLHIFVVEENKSYFDFNDRLMLIKQGTSDLSNVIVMPSGKFIISALTFPGYFYKDNNKDAIIDTSLDIDLFGKYIAPSLGISVRFAGEEPLDPITRQYNQTMEERLPLYKIDFIEIKRKESGNAVISASRVRKLLKENNFEEIKELVPLTTYTYLVEKFG